MASSLLGRSLLWGGVAWLDGCSDVELDAVGECLLLDALLHLHHDLVLEHFFLSLLNLGRFGLLGRSAALVALVHHLQAKPLDWNRKVETAARFLLEC